jgi:superoxide dismutase, Fe-Mn family
MTHYTPNRRDFLRAALVGVPVAVSALGFAQNTRRSDQTTTTSAAGSTGDSGPFELPKLPYANDALEPHIDARTMEIHHDKHHAGYVSKLNQAVAKHSDLADKSIEELIRGLDQIPEDIRNDVRNQGGGHLNHSIFWPIMTPGGPKEPSGELANAIKSSFGSFDDFKKTFQERGEKHFGSGWVWLVKPSNGKLDIVTTANQDNPLSKGQFPILGNDLWEHAYYLKYQNKRADYLKAWWNVVNWEKVEERFSKAG